MKNENNNNTEKKDDPAVFERMDIIPEYKSFLRRLNRSYLDWDVTEYMTEKEFRQALHNAKPVLSNLHATRHSGHTDSFYNLLYEFFNIKYNFGFVQEFVKSIHSPIKKLRFFLEVSTDFNRDFEYLNYLNGHGYEVLKFEESCLIEIERLKRLIDLEKLEEANVEKSAPEEKENLKRKFGGTRYQNLLAIHYILEYLSAGNNKKAKARFVSFLTGFSEGAIYNENTKLLSEDKFSENAEKVKKFFDDLNLTEISKMIDNDIDSACD